MDKELKKSLTNWLNSIDESNKDYNITIGSSTVNDLTPEMLERAKAKNWNIIISITLELPEGYFD